MVKKGQNTVSDNSTEPLAVHSAALPSQIGCQPTINALNSEPIAIIGMSCRFPQAENIDQYLSLLEHGESGMTDIPFERWDNEEYYDSDPDALGMLYIKQLGLLKDVKKFDADFFNVSPREAKLMAPQLRIYMETCFHALESANLPLDAVQGCKAGVFVGVGTNEYPRILLAEGVLLEELNIYFSTGNVLNAVAGRVAYSFDFHGPIQAIDTACSSSMTAIHNACISLQAGDCDLALAGGINILLTAESNITLSKAKMLSPESRCKTFSDDADGYARSEGCGVVVLKRLSEALSSNDTILAVIKGSAINSDGKGGGFTVPNGRAQEEVIRSALARAQLTPADIDCIEAHGTGTPLGDPIEANTLMDIFADAHSPENPLYLGSVKTNIGHSESASGVAGLIKAILSMQSKQHFKHLNFNQLNPGIELKNTVIPFAKMPWHKKDGLRCIGVSSFGFSGANAHVIVQELPSHTIKKQKEPAESLLLLSAKSQESLLLLLASYQRYLVATEDDFADVCYTAAVGRSHFLFRVVIKATTARQAAELIAKQHYVIYSLKREQKATASLHTLEQVHDAYQQGIKIDWNAFYNSLNSSFNKVKLPLYEFDRKEYWYEQTDRIKFSKLPKDWCFQVQWQQLPVDMNHLQKKRGQWLLLGAPHLASNFIDQGFNVIGTDQPYELSRLEGVIFAAALDASDEPTDFIELQKNTIKKLLALVKELDSLNVSLQLIVLTAKGIDPLNDAVNLNNSSLIGFCNTLVLELPQYHTIVIDLDKPEEPHAAALVFDEIQTNYGLHYEHLIAYRDSQRFVYRLKKMSLADPKELLCTKTGRYLITGGCGGLGLVSAQSLLAAGAKELILVSRSTEKAEAQESIKKMQLSYPGRIIRAIRIDITDKKQVAQLISELNADGLLKGIIHAAGAAIKAPLTEHQSDDVDYLFAAKVQGAWHLHELSQGCNLDFFIVYSSISSIFGSNKEAVYGAANSFLDGLIRKRKELGLVGTAIQWGPWGEVGLARKRARDNNVKQDLISNEQGHVLLRAVISNQLTQATIISPGYLNFMLDFVPQPQPGFHRTLAHDLTVNQESMESPGLSSWLNDYIALTAIQRTQACHNLVADICKKILDLSSNDDLDADEGFFELGFDSLMIAELASTLKKKLEPTVKVMINIGFNYPSINKLAQYLELKLNGNLLSEQHKPVADDIAIIGMSCSFPNAPDIAAFERLLEAGENGVQDIPKERWDNSLYYDPDVNAAGKSYVNKLGLIADIKLFDAQFFGISPREAKLIDPQQRIFLECSYTALEHANYPIRTLQGSATGVFVGVGPNEFYAQLEQSGFSNEELSVYSITGNVLNLIPGRVTYAFDFKGPALSVDTACSSSLVAIHYACQSLKNGEIDYALAGGVNILLRPESNVTLCRAKALSPDGQCKSFDEAADGYARAEGCGVIVLKRLADALRDKDTVLAVIKGTAVNNDGRSVGLTAPNGERQAEVMSKALSQTDLLASDISYFEAHGTGTRLGDPIEVSAINKVYGASRDSSNPLYLGTVKTNIGHLEAASGIAGVIKTVISLQKKKIYKHLHFKQLNHNIELNQMRIALQNTPWKSASALRCAGVNAFGFSGTNAHAIIQEAAHNQVQRAQAIDQAYLLVLSAKSTAALDKLAKRYQEYLASTQDHFSDICFTAATCREHYTYRLALVAKNTQDASQLLANGTFSLSHENYILPKLDDNSQLSSLMTAYLKEEQIDWQGYYKNLGQEFSKVHLPNYTFNREEFWPDKKNTFLSPVPHVYPLEQMPADESYLSHLYCIQWSAIQLKELNQEPLPDFIVVSTDSLRAKKILAGLQYELVHDSSKLVDIKNKNIIYLYQQEQFNDLFHCCQKLFHTQPNSFILITEQAYAVTAEDDVNPYHTMAAAFWKSFKNELALPRNYFLDWTDNSTAIKALRYLFTPGASENQLASRDALYAPRLKNTALAMAPEPERLFDSQAQYLIVGGTGGLAQLLLEYLIQRGVRHISITSRSGCSTRLLSFIAQAKERQVLIKHYQADSSNYQQMEQVFHTIELDSIPLKGVFHLAGVVQDGLIVNLTDESMHKVLSAKMDSALIVHQLTQHCALDLFVLFSSSASLLGARGQANYVAANGFLDGLAYFRQQQGLAAQSINWGPFNAIGMTEGSTYLSHPQGFIPLEKGSIFMLDQLLAASYPQIALCPINWNTYIKSLPPQVELSELVQKKEQTQSQLLVSLAQHNKEERIALLSQALCEISADVLALNNPASIQAEDDLFTLGMDSLMAVEIRSRIHDQLQLPNLSLSIEYFINDPSIAKIAQVIADELPVVLDNQLEHNQGQEAIINEIALCDFQYVFWVLNQFNYSYNIGMQLQLQGALNKEYLEQAFNHVIQSHSVFRISFNPEIPVQKLVKHEPFAVSYHDLSLDSDGTPLNGAFRRNIEAFISLEKPPLIRVHLYKINSDLHELHIVIPNIIVDGKSCDLILNQFKNSYEALSSGKKLIAPPEDNTYFNYVQKSNEHYENKLGEKIKFWHSYNQGYQKLYFGTHYHLPDATVNNEPNLEHYTIPLNLMERFINWHQTNNYNMSSGIIVLSHLAFYVLTRQKKIPLILIHTGREGGVQQSSVGLFAEYKRINSIIYENNQFVDCIDFLEEQFLKTAPYQKCSHFIKDGGLVDERLSWLESLFYVWNKCFRNQSFKKSGLKQKIINIYLKTLSSAQCITTENRFKYKLKRLFNWNIAVQKPVPLRTIINITPSLFAKSSEVMHFANIHYHYPNHFAYADRLTGNHTLMIFFSRDLEGAYQLSINGPITSACKEQIAIGFNRIMANFLEKEDERVADLIK